MKPYYQDEQSTIYLGDCRDILPELPKVDLVLTDPPYGIDENSDKNNSRGGCANPKNYGEYHWDKKIDEYLIALILLKGRNSIIWGGNYYANWLKPSTCWLVWYKDNGTNDFADCELAWTSFSTAVRYFKYRWNGMIQENMKDKEFRFHPTQKPVPLMNWVLSKYSEVTDLVLDPFMGSGTTLVAAKKLGRKAIGIEISEKYCEIAVNRLRQTVMDLEIPKEKIEQGELIKE
jgi:DNA modification methylase